jgi:hypothetical protein
MAHRPGAQDPYLAQLCARTLGSFSQSGKYTFVNDKLVHVALEEAKSGGLSTAAAESDWELEGITPTEMVVNFKGYTNSSTFKKVE